MNANNSQSSFQRTSSGFNPDGQLSYALPGEYYYSPEIFEKEKAAIWYSSWQYIGNAEDLINPGDYVTGDVHGQEIVVIREDGDNIRAFHNVCKHRGHLLLQGKGRATRMVCPFHGWCYGRNGELIFAPNQNNMLHFNKSEFALSEVAVEQFGPWIFVNLDKDAESLDSMAGDMLAEMREMIPGFDTLTASYQHTFDIKANWKFILDGLECYHCPYLHPSVMGPNEGYMTQTFETTLRDWSSTHIGYTNREYLENNKDKLPYDFGEMDIKDVLIWYLWPNIVFVSHQGPSNVKILQAVSDGPETCRRHIYGFTKTKDLTEHDLQHVAHYVDVVWPQDQGAIESQMRGVKSLGFKQGRLMVDKDNSWASEAGTHHFEHLVWRALNGDKY